MTGLALFAALFALFALGIALIVRSTAAAIAASHNNCLEVEAWLAD